MNGLKLFMCDPTYVTTIELAKEIRFKKREHYITVDVFTFDDYLLHLGGVDPEP